VLATAIAVPVTVVLVLLLNRSALRHAATPPAPSTAPTVTASPSTTRFALPALRVPAPPASAAAERFCPRLLAAMPLTLTGLAARPVDSPSPNVAAWGEPPVVLRCGVPRPRGFVVGVQTFVVNGVTWFAEPHGNRTVWTVVDRPVYVEATVPAGYAGGPVSVLSTEVARTLPAQAPRPGPG
jgi:Protein of unknown function (DUF3515)